jgi:hypothetical protein
LWLYIYWLSSTEKSVCGYCFVLFVFLFGLGLDLACCALIFYLNHAGTSGRGSSFDFFLLFCFLRPDFVFSSILQPSCLCQVEFSCLVLGLERSGVNPATRTTQHWWPVFDLGSCPISHPIQRSARALKSRFLPVLRWLRPGN